MSRDAYKIIDLLCFFRQLKHGARYALMCVIKYCVYKNKITCRTVFYQQVIGKTIVELITFTDS